jgi:hypothetical protein
MRLLLGPIAGSSQVTDPFLDAPGLDLVSFGGSGATIPYDPGTEPLERIFAQLPSGWSPDVLIWSGPEYTVIPDGPRQEPRADGGAVR